jgi:hypothetical protein
MSEDMWERLDLGSAILGFASAYVPDSAFQIPAFCTLIIPGAGHQYRA